MACASVSLRSTTSTFGVGHLLILLCVCCVRSRTPISHHGAGLFSLFANKSGKITKWTKNSRRSGQSPTDDSGSCGKNYAAKGVDYVLGASDGEIFGINSSNGKYWRFTSFGNAKTKNGYPRDLAPELLSVLRKPEVTSLTQAKYRSGYLVYAVSDTGKYWTFAGSINKCKLKASSIGGAFGSRRQLCACCGSSSVSLSRGHRPSLLRLLLPATGRIPKGHRWLVQRQRLMGVSHSGHGPWPKARPRGLGISSIQQPQSASPWPLLPARPPVACAGLAGARWAGSWRLGGNERGKPGLSTYVFERLHRSSLRL